MTWWVLLALIWPVPAFAGDPTFWLSPLVSTVQADGGIRYEAALNSYVLSSPDAALGAVTAVARSASGHPTVLWGLVATCASGLTPDPSNLRLPGPALDTPIGLTVIQLTALKAALAQKGMDGSALTPLSTLRTVAMIVLAKLGNFPKAHLTWRGGACP